MLSIHILNSSSYSIVSIALFISFVISVLELPPGVLSLSPSWSGCSLGPQQVARRTNHNSFSRNHSFQVPFVVFLWFMPSFCLSTSWRSLWWSTWNVDMTDVKHDCIFFGTLLIERWFTPFPWSLDRLVTASTNTVWWKWPLREGRARTCFLAYWNIYFGVPRLPMLEMPWGPKWAWPSSYPHHSSRLLSKARPEYHRGPPLTPGSTDTPPSGAMPEFLAHKVMRCDKSC